MRRAYPEDYVSVIWNAMQKEKTSSPLSGFARFLVMSNYLKEDVAQKAFNDALHKKMSLILYLGQYNILPYNKLAKITAEYFGLPLFDLSRYELKALPKNILTTDLIQKHSALPLHKIDNQLLLAVTDPSLPNLSEINFLTGLTTTLIIVEANMLTRIIDEIYSSELEQGFAIEDVELEDIDIAPNNVQTVDEAQLESDKAPIIRFINKILLDAINKGASDIHFEPYENYYRIRFRIDGILYETNKQPIKLASYFTARLKIMANLDISEHRIPQDGRFKMNLSRNRAIDFRLNICPTLFGEKAVLRILESSTELLNIETLGMNQEQIRLFQNAISYSQGMILVTGPTGSGKTVTLYTAMGILNTADVNISSVEDPVEIHLPGINQVQINIKTGMTFARALRAFLRQDPDIIMVGEVRDLETAEIAVKAAQTGHLVLSTLHTNSAPETLIRLSNMGVEPFNIASSIILIIAQRLVRVLCQRCKQLCDLPEKILLDLGFTQEEVPTLKIYKPTGCNHCNDGYKGRIGIYEVMPISKDMARLIMEGAGSLDLAAQARKEHVPDLRQAGLEKVRLGITSLEEINRVTTE